MIPRPWFFAGLAILALAATLGPPTAQLAWHLSGHTGVLPASYAPSAEARGTAPAPAGTDNILALAPFGTANAPPPETEAKAQGREIDIDLHGVLVSTDPEMSRALIAVAGNVDRYRIGDSLSEGVRLTAIGPEAIEVEIDGEARRFGFDGALDGSAPAPEATAEAAPADAPASPLDRLRATIVPGRGSLDLREAPPPETTQEYIDLWRGRIIEDPQSVLDTIGLVPGPEGYRIDANPNIGVTLAGLKPGDLVTKVNGQAVGDPDEDRTFYDEVAASGQARLEVVRDGETLLMSFPLR